ncbi:hypothetical protein [Sphingomonas radiodurans]|uniref:hypothetical protein n=1 Tax=Sphingomonas radiodurans TaxID=2890321 RepID=UPI001E35DB26|nr:hypothetical protein [Sphingomonas radiodurans]WBH17045.1 hypothetical protein LLW23_02685 [Sphingomonas radiodurans]
MPVNQRFLASRNATWAPTLIYDYEGAALPLTGAAIAMELRLYPGQAGAANLRLANIPFSDALVSGAPGSADERRRLSLLPFATSAQLSVLPGLHAPELGEPFPFAFDILITYADGLSEILSSGTFVLSPGVTTT